MSSAPGFVELLFSFLLDVLKLCFFGAVLLFVFVLVFAITSRPENETADRKEGIPLEETV